MPGHFKRQTMLRIHLRRFAVPQAEEGRIKALNVRDIAAWRQLIAFRPVGRPIAHGVDALIQQRSEEHTSELQSLMRISYAVFCLKKKKTYNKVKELNPNAVKTSTELTTPHR